MNKQIKDITGKRFGRWLVLFLKQENPPLWNCICDCGNKRLILGTTLRSKRSKSCGCYSVDQTKISNTRHGKKGTRVYRIWSGMKQRCVNPNAASYNRYGGNGIDICEEWMNFENFYKDMGEPPNNYTIDRIDNKKGYCKKNCRWVSWKMQAYNRDITIKFVFKGKEKCLYDLWKKYSKPLGLSYGCVNSRLKRGMDLEKAMFTPIKRELPFSKERRKIMRVAHGNGFKTSDIAKFLGLSHRSIYDVISGKTYKKEYNEFEQLKHAICKGEG